MVETIRRLTRTTSKLEYAKCLQLLSADTPNEIFYNDLMSCSANLCMMDIPNVFIGPIDFNDGLRISEILEKPLGNRYNYIKTIKKLRLLDRSFIKASKDMKDKFGSEIEEAFNDPRIKAVRLGYGRRVCDMFL
jgi:hypothetical protein